MHRFPSENRGMHSSLAAPPTFKLALSDVRGIIIKNQLKIVFH
jgi:hypothetical protein